MLQGMLWKDCWWYAVPKDQGLGFRGLGFRVRNKAWHLGTTLTYQKPTFLQVLMLNPNMDSIGTLQKVGFGRSR